MSLWWGWKLSSVVPGEKDLGLHAELFVLQGEKIPRQVGLHAELFVLLVPGEKDTQSFRPAVVRAKYTPILKLI